MGSKDAPAAESSTTHTEDLDEAKQTSGVQHWLTVDSKSGKLVRRLWARLPVYAAETSLGKRLRLIRAQYIEGGGKLVSLDEIEEEVEKRRGHSNADEDLR